MINEKESPLDSGKSSGANKILQDENTDIIKKRWTEGGQTVGAMHLSVTEKRMTLIMMNRNGEVIDEVSIPAKR